jgi:hypothetical protein
MMYLDESGQPVQYGDYGAPEEEYYDGYPQDEWSQGSDNYYY